MSLCDLCNGFKMSHSFDKVIRYHEIISIFFSCFLILYYLLVKHPSFSSQKSPKNSPDSISSQYLSPNHLMWRSGKCVECIVTKEQQHLGGKAANSSSLQFSMRLLSKARRREPSHWSSQELPWVGSRHGQIMPCWPSSHGKLQGAT